MSVSRPEKWTSGGVSALPIYYLDGPPDMVGAMRQMLSEAGVGDDHIRTEEFSGY